MDPIQLDLLIEQKEKEIGHYIGVLDRYQSGRWYDQGRRHLEELREELKELRSQSIDGDAPAS